MGMFIILVDKKLQHILNLSIKLTEIGHPIAILNALLLDNCIVNQILPFKIINF